MDTQEQLCDFQYEHNSYFIRKFMDGKYPDEFAKFRVLRDRRKRYLFGLFWSQPYCLAILGTQPGSRKRWCDNNGNFVIYGDWNKRYEYFVLLQFYVRISL